LIAAWLLRAIWRRYFPETAIWVVAAGILSVGISAGTLVLLSPYCEIYQAAATSAFAFTMLAVAAIWQTLNDPKRQVWWMLLASLAYGLAVGSRPTMLVEVIILLAPPVCVWRAEGTPVARRQAGLLLLAAVGPAMAIGIGLMSFNKLRFDNPFDFGWHYLLTGFDPNLVRSFSPHYLWFNFQDYFFKLMRWSGHFPFLQVVPTPPLPAGYFWVDKPYGGILTLNYPLAWMALAVPLAWRGRPVKDVSILAWFVTAVAVLFLISLFTLCLFFSVSCRYELEFLPALTLLSVIGILGWERAMASWPGCRLIIRRGWLLLLAASIVLNLLACVESIAEAHYFVGNNLVRNSRMDEAIGHFETALTLEPGSAAFQAGLGTAYFRKKQWDKAIIQFEKALKTDPGFSEAAEAHVNLGYSLLYEGQINEAIVHFQKALEIKPGLAEVHNSLGDCLLQGGRMEEAVNEYQKAVEIKPDFAEAQNNLGYGLMLSGRANEAIAHFEKALKSAPNFAEAHYNLACGCLQVGKVDDAIVHFQKSIELNPHLVPAYNSLGDAYRQKGMAAEAMATYRKAIDLQPQFITPQINLAWMLATWPEPSVRDGNKAIALALQASQISKKEDPLVLQTLAAAYAETGRFPEALATPDRRSPWRWINPKRNWPANCRKRWGFIKIIRPAILPTISLLPLSHGNWRGQSQKTILPTWIYQPILYRRIVVSASCAQASRPPRRQRTFFRPCPVK
jgi:tetratricopeptide (TPR) repeat protein